MPKGLRFCERDAQYTFWVAVKDGCVFCDYEGPSAVLVEYELSPDCFFVIEPLNPVVPGHVLVISVEHVRSAAFSPRLAEKAMWCAADWARQLPSSNIITSNGGPATQTIEHLHLHVIPRYEGDGVTLPWTPNAEI
jgi:histidine triad (HIT) family protein